MLMLVMLDVLVKSGYQGQVNWFYVVENGDVYVFVDEVKVFGVVLLVFIFYVWYCILIEVDCQVGCFDSEGLMDLVVVVDNICDLQMQYYFCGLVVFMQFVVKQLVELGINKDNIYYECFGLYKVL